jgi:hypothetical protein
MSQQQQPRRGPPNLPEEPPAIPLTRDEAKDRNTYIRDMVKVIERYQKEGKSTAEMDELVPEFKRDYPKLYETLTAPGGYNKQSLQTMLFMLEKMGGGQLSQNDASVIVGQRMFDMYVKPQIGEEPPH